MLLKDLVLEAILRYSGEVCVLILPEIKLIFFPVAAKVLCYLFSIYRETHADGTLTFWWLLSGAYFK